MSEGRAFGRTQYGLGRHVVRSRFAGSLWPARALCGVELVEHAEADVGALCGCCERSMVAAEDTARRSADTSGMLMPVGSHGPSDGGYHNPRHEATPSAEQYRASARLPRDARLRLIPLHPQVPCGGLPGRCPDCIAVYRVLVGDAEPTCMVCDGRHFAYEEHTS